MASFILLLFELYAVGIIAYFLGSFLVGLIPVIGPKLQRFNLDLVMELLNRALLIKSAHGGFKLKASWFDPVTGKDVINHGGELRYFSDPNDLMSTFRGKAFGIAHGARDTIVSPIEIHLAEIAEELDGNNELQIEKDGERFTRAFFHLDEGIQLVDADKVLRAIQGSADGASADRAMHFIELSQADYDSAAIEDYAVWISALGLPFLLMMVGSKVADDSGGSGLPDVTLPMIMDVMTLLL